MARRPSRELTTFSVPGTGSPSSPGSVHAEFFSPTSTVGCAFCIHRWMRSADFSASTAGRHLLYLAGAGFFGSAFGGLQVVADACEAGTDDAAIAIPFAASPRRRERAGNRALGVARSTIQDNLKRAGVAGMQWPLPDDVPTKFWNSGCLRRAASTRRPQATGRTGLGGIGTGAEAVGREHDGPLGGISGGPSGGLWLQTVLRSFSWVRRRPVAGDAPASCRGRQGVRRLFGQPPALRPIWRDPELQPAAVRKFGETGAGFCGAHFQIGEGHVGIFFVGSNAIPTNIPTFGADASARLNTSVDRNPALTNCFSNYFWTTADGGG